MTNGKESAPGQTTPIKRRSTDSTFPLIGTIVSVIGVGHLSLAPTLFRDAIRGILADGIINSVEARREELDSRGHAFWYGTLGVTLLGMATLIGSLERRTDPLPPSVGVVLLGMSAWGVALLPKSGFWLLLLPATLALVRSRTRTGRSSHAATDVNGTSR